MILKRMMQETGCYLSPFRSYAGQKKSELKKPDENAVMKRIRHFRGFRDRELRFSRKSKINEYFRGLKFGVKFSLAGKIWSSLVLYSVNGPFLRREYGVLHDE
jgi:hypothetical protein